MGCQKEIPRKIMEKWHADLARYEYLDASHSRLTTQNSWTAPADAATVNTEEWPNCRTVAIVASLCQVGDKSSDLERRYYISSRDMTPETLANAVRAHRAVENKLHWILDVNSDKDTCRVKKDNAPDILSLVRQVVINTLSLDSTQSAFTRKKLSKRQKRKSPTGMMTLCLSSEKTLPRQTHAYLFWL